MSIDAEAKTAKIQGGEEVAFGQALLGTGAMVNILRLEGAENEGIHYLRAYGNADAIREDAKEAKKVVLVGGSYIAAEVAASLAAIGTDCTMVAVEEVALSRTFGEDAGRFFQEGLEEHGVTFVGGESVSAFEGDGRVSSVLTESGKAFECDLVVVGAGVRPDMMLAQRAGLECDDGILCDSKLQTSRPGDLRGGRRLQLRERHPRPPDPGRALGRGDAAGHARGEEHARRRRRLRRRSLLLQRSRRLGEHRVRRPGRRVGPRGLARLARARASSRSGTCSPARWRDASAWAAPKTSPKPAACSPKAPI